MGRTVFNPDTSIKNTNVKFQNLKIQGAFIINLDLLVDERGFFSRTFCKKEFQSHGLNPNLVQCNITFNKNKGTLRGMHYQSKPLEEAKLVRVISGAIYDVLLDVRPDSPTFKNWMSVDLTASDRKLLYGPEGVAHGYQTLVKNTEVFYQMSEFYRPSYTAGIRWDDPTFNIKWPLSDKIISDKDRDYSSFGE